MFIRAATAYPDNDCFGWRPVLGPDQLGPFEYISYGTAAAMVKETSSGVAGLKLPPKCTFGMYTANCMAFQIATLGCFAQAPSRCELWRAET